jgi:uncharacterized protein YbjT (DUF2867 family)
MLAIVGASGKLGYATLSALLEHNLVPGSKVVCTTSSDAGAEKLSAFRSSHGIHVRSATWDDPSSLESALQGCDKLFLISSSRIQKDFFDAVAGEGREADHFIALEAAKKVGVKHVYYTSLAFAKPSKSRVMKAHERTEDWLENQKDFKWTVIREGLYNESWPLYLGHYDFPKDDRREVPVAGDSKISWTAIADLGLATAMILTAEPQEWAGNTCYLSQRRAVTIAEVAGLVAKAREQELSVKIVSRDEHEKYYIQERGKDEGYIKWWAKTYDALRDNECEIQDSTLEELLAKKAVKPKPIEDTVQEMFASS